MVIAERRGLSGDVVEFLSDLRDEIDEKLAELSIGEDEEDEDADSDLDDGDDPDEGIDLDDDEDDED